MAQHQLAPTVDTALEFIAEPAVRQPRALTLKRLDRSRELRPSAACRFQGCKQLGHVAAAADRVDVPGDLGVLRVMDDTLPARDREMLILRIGWLCRAEYEWAQHTPIGRAAGLTEDDLAHIIKGPDATGVPAHDKLLLRAATELHDKASISDETWNALAKIYDTKQMMDLVFTVGDYTVVSMAINSFGMQLEPGVTGFPPGTR